MNWLLLLEIAYITLLLLALVMAKGRLVSPSVIFSASFSVMLIFTNVFQEYFQFQIKAKTFWVMLIAGVIFLLTEHFYRLTVSTVRVRSPYRTRKQEQLHSLTQNKPIEIQPFVQNVFLAIMIFGVFFAVFNLFYFAGGSGSWNAMMSAYRRTKLYTRGTARLQFTIVNQIVNIAVALAHVCTYILVYNRQVCGIPVLPQKRLALIALLFAPLTSISTGGRQATVELAIFIFIIVLLLAPMSKKKLKIWKLLLQGLVFLSVFFIVFTGAATLVGRVEKYRDPILYVADYLCSGLANFNQGIDSPSIHEYWGQATFANLYSLVNKFGLIPDEMVLSYHSSGWVGEYASSTTVTIFGRWYEDFGTTGVFVMSGVVSLIFSYLMYSKILHKPSPNLFHIIFAQQAMALVWASYDDRFYSLLAVGNVIKLLLMAFFYWLTVGRGRRFKFVFGKKRHLLRD